MEPLPMSLSPRLPMGLSCEVDTSEEDRQGLTTDGARGGTDSSSAVGMEFWPLEHPVEPSDEDQPVKCPMTSSFANDVVEMSKDCSTETPRKRMESTGTTRRREVTTVADAGSPTARLDRKRHHTMTHRDIIITPIMRTMPLPQPMSARELTVLQMLHQTDSLEP